LRFLLATFWVGEPPELQIQPPTQTVGRCESGRNSFPSLTHVFHVPLKARIHIPLMFHFNNQIKRNLTAHLDFSASGQFSARRLFSTSRFSSPFIPTSKASTSLPHLPLNRLISQTLRALHTILGREILPSTMESPPKRRRYFDVLPPPPLLHPAKNVP
jgi:hypothetical protein